MPSPRMESPQPLPSPATMGSTQPLVGHAVFTRTLTQRTKVLEGTSAQRRHPRTQTTRAPSRGLTAKAQSCGSPPL